MTPQMPRNNAEWLADLRDPAAQAEALADLRVFLLRAALFYLEGHYQDVASLARHELEQMAEDFAQEALLQIRARLSTFRGESKFTTWAYRFVINLIAGELRLRRWQTLSVETLVGQTEAPLSAFLSSQQAPNPETVAARNQILTLIRQVIDQELTERQRFALISVHFRGMPLNEVARQLDSTPNNVYKLIHDARKKLKAGLRRRYYSEADVLAIFGEQ